MKHKTYSFNLIKENKEAQKETETCSREISTSLAWMPRLRYTATNGGGNNDTWIFTLY